MYTPYVEINRKYASKISLKICQIPLIEGEICLTEQNLTVPGFWTFDEAHRFAFEKECYQHDFE